jgi:hypothetical protein
LDPVSGTEIRGPAFSLHVPRGIVEDHRIVLEDFSGAIKTFMRNAQEKHQHEAISKIVREAMEKSMPGEGKIIEQEHIQMFAQTAADRFVRHLFRIDSEVPLDLDTLEPDDGDEDT